MADLYRYIRLGEAQWHIAPQYSSSSSSGSGMKFLLVVCVSLGVAVIGSTAGSASADQAPAVADQNAAQEPTTSGNRRGRFFSLFNWLGFRKQPEVAHVAHVQTIHRPIHVSPVIVIDPHVHPGTPVHPGSGGCLADLQCPKGYHCYGHKCVQCTSDEHCNPIGWAARHELKKRCVHHQCVDIWNGGGVPRCTKFSCPSGKYCSTTGECEPYVPVWLPCSSDESCQSNSCLQGKCAECSHWRPCPQGQFCDHGHCKNPGNQGDKCWLSLQCKSHICWNGVCADCAHTSDCDASNEYCEKGQCKSLREYGARCSENSQCSSRLCDSYTRRCVGCKSSLTCSENSYCSADLKCVQKGPFKAPCRADSQCLSNRCGPKNKCVRCNRQEDCGASTHFCDISGGGDCVALKRLGETCETNEQCRASLSCNTNTNKCVQCQLNLECAKFNQRCDIPLGMCVKKSSKEDRCTGDSDCDTGVCVFGSGRCGTCDAGRVFCPNNMFCTSGGACVPSNVQLGGECVSQETHQCANGLVCIGRTCVLPPTDPITSNPSPITSSIPPNGSIAPNGSIVPNGSTAPNGSSTPNGFITTNVLFISPTSTATATSTRR